VPCLFPAHRSCTASHVCAPVLYIAVGQALVLVVIVIFFILINNIIIK